MLDVICPKCGCKAEQFEYGGTHCPVCGYKSLDQVVNRAEPVSHMTGLKLVIRRFVADQYAQERDYSLMIGETYCCLDEPDDDCSNHSLRRAIFTHCTGGRTTVDIRTFLDSVVLLFEYHGVTEWAWSQ